MILLVLLLLGSVVTAFKCNFDSSICGFVQDSNDDFDWTRLKGSTPSYGTGPSADHSTGNGYYMYIETSSPRVKGDKAKLHSPKLQFNGYMCLKFYYHMNGPDIERLNVIINGNNVFSACKEKGNKWLLAAIDVSFLGTYEVTFEGIRGKDYQGDIAIDDFVLEQRSCTTTIGCNFDVSTCGFVQDTNDKFDWTRRKGRTLSTGTGPPADHTTGNGYYMYIETSSPRRQGDNAKLNSPTLLFIGKMCITFYYHMLGKDIETLNVIINGNKVFTASGDKGDKWLRAAIDVNLSGDFAITFEGIRGSSWQGDIAIDDFLLEQGCCPSTFSCNFDTSSICWFVQDSNDKFDWTRRKGSTPSYRTGPSADHTTGSGYYMYIETSSPRRKNDNAKLKSPKLQFSGNMCLTFYYHMYGSDIATLNVIINGNIVFTASGDKGNKWLLATIDVNLSGEHEVIFEATRGGSYHGDIAIDDVMLEPGICPANSHCGIRPSSRIVGGVNAKHGDWPWQVQLRTTSGSSYCGGSLVSDQWVVTATHCVEGKSPSSILVRLGAHRRDKLVGTEQDIQVSKVITHQSYRNPLCRSNDIALLKLATPAQLNRHVNLVCLPRYVNVPSDGNNCWITGWGTLSYKGASPDYLQQAQVPVVSRARCVKSHPGDIDESMMCAGLDKGGIDTCQGDSGGPMVCETGGRFYLQGATSWGYGCASPGKFGVYAKVKYLLSWIVSQMSKN